MKKGDFKSEYGAWVNMKHRCLNPNHKQYEDYGGRGISVCEEWVDDFFSFLAHIGPKPTAELTLERINNNGNYEPGNVKWQTRRGQQLNRRNPTGCRKITYNGVTQDLEDWATCLGMKRSTLQMRLDDGWDVDRAFNTPVRIYTKSHQKW